MEFQRLKKLFLLLIGILLYSLNCFSQIESSAKIKMKLSGLYLNYEYEKCNKKAKRYLRKSEIGSPGHQTALYYLALTYATYSDWYIYDKRKIMHDKYDIMTIKPIAYLDSAMFYNELYVNEVGEVLLNDTLWQNDLFRELYRENTFSLSQAINHDYNNEEMPEMYINHTEELDSYIRHISRLHNLSLKYNKSHALETYFQLVIIKRNFNLIDISENELGIFFNLYEDYLTNDGYPHSMSLVWPVLFRATLDWIQNLDIDNDVKIKWFYKFCWLFESYNFKLNDICTNSSGEWLYNEVPIFQLSVNEIDLGTFIIGDSIRQGKEVLSKEFEIPFFYDLYEGDTLRIVDLKDVSYYELNRVELIEEFKNKVWFGTGSDTLKFVFRDPSGYRFSKEREWRKEEFQYKILTNRGWEKFEVIFRYKYVE